MAETIAAIIGLCLALYGVTEAIRRLAFWLLMDHRHGTERLLFFAQGAQDEHRVRRLAAWWRWCPCGGFEPTVVLTDGEETMYRLCEELRLTVYSQKEWNEMCKMTLQDEKSTV